MGSRSRRKGKPKPKSGEKSAKAMTPSSWRTLPTTTTTTRGDVAGPLSVAVEV
jgi:hypothetical protein